MKKHIVLAAIMIVAPVTTWAQSVPTQPKAVFEIKQPQRNVIFVLTTKPGPTVVINGRKKGPSIVFATK